MNRLKKKICLAMCIIVGLLIVWDKSSSRLTNSMLLESKHSSYYDLFWHDLLCNNQMNSQFLESTNLLVLEPAKVKVHEGVGLTFNDDGTILIQGTKQGENTIFFRLTPLNRFRLASGVYKFECGNEGISTPGIIFNYEARNFKEDQVEYTGLASLRQQPTFSVDSSLYDDSGLVLAITAEFDSPDPITIYPQIRRVDDPPNEYEPPAILKATIDEDQPAFQTFLVDKPEFDQLTDSDWEIFKNNLKYQYHGTYVWTSIIFEDGTGVQFKDSDADQAVYGPIDPWGRVDEPVCEVHSLDEIKAAYQPV